MQQLLCQEKQQGLIANSSTLLPDLLDGLAVCGVPLTPFGHLEHSKTIKNHWGGDGTPPGKGLHSYGQPPLLRKFQ